MQFLGACLEPDLLLVTEYAERSSLFHALKDPSLPLKLSIKLILDVAKGMLYLHTRSPPIVHRDIKSLNILVSFSPPSRSNVFFCFLIFPKPKQVTHEYKAVVADFGLTKIKSKEYLKTYCGSPAWTAPEVLRGQQYDESADVYRFLSFFF